MAPNSILPLPPIAILAEAAATLIERAAGDASTERAINKALWNLDGGIEIRSTYGGFLMPSGTRAGVIHRVSTVQGCSCEAARAGRVCWHASALAIIEEAQTRAIPIAAKIAAQRGVAYAKAMAEMDELFG